MSIQIDVSGIMSYFDDIEHGCSYYLELLADANGVDEALYKDYRFLPFEDYVYDVENCIDDLYAADKSNDERAGYDALESLQQTLTSLQYSVNAAKKNEATAEACEEILEIIKDMLDYVEDSMSDLEDEF